MAQELFLDGPMPDIVKQWRHYLSLLGVRDGDRVVDVGCDTGDALRLLAREQAGAGCLTGIEYSAMRCRRAVSRWRNDGADPRIVFRRADARALPFADATFDRAICAEALEFIDPPALALREIRRVLKPGGVALIVHTDWDTQVFATRDPARSRRMVAAFAGEGPGGRMGRQLPGLCRTAGFADVETSTYTLINDSWQSDHYAPGVVRLMTRWLTQDPAVSADDLQAWIADVEAAAADGSFCYAVVRFVCRCVA